MPNWVLDFSLDVEEVKEEYGDEIPSLPYAQLCDWFLEQLRSEFPRYVIIEPMEDARDEETFGVRMVAASPFRPEAYSKYFDLMDVNPFEDIYGDKVDE